jgi:hypothetical protein
MPTLDLGLVAVKVEILEDTALVYRLRIHTNSGVIDTPNLKGADGRIPVEDVIEQLSQYSFLADDPKRAMSINMPLSGLPTVQNTDGTETELEDGDILLLCGQADGKENGMWIVHTEDWERHPSYPEGDTSSFTDKFIVPREGLFANICFYLETRPYTVGSTELNFLGSIFATAAVPGKIPMFNRDGSIGGMEGGVTNVSFTGLTADGGESQRTTKLTLVFSEEIPGLSVSDIELTANATGAVKGSLAGTETAGTYELVLSGIADSGSITVAVVKHGYAISPESRSVDVYYAAGTSVAASANGSDTVTSSEITLTFTGDDGELEDIDDLTAADITLGSEVTKGSLTHPSTGIYKLIISDLFASLNVSVSVTKAGYNITPESQDVYCYYAVPISFESAVPNESGGTTVSVTLTFSEAVAGLTAADFTVTANGTGAARGSLSGSGPGYVLTLDGVSASGTAIISVSKSGFAISGSPKSVAIVKSPYNYDGVVDNSTMGSDNLLTKLSTATVADAVDILHTMINADGVSGFGDLHIGDYLDLPSITIAADSDAANTPIGTIVNDTTYENLRIVIAGFNLWKGLDGNTKNHILFTFKQIPCSARHNTSNTSTGGYPASKLRAFLLDEFLTGLKAALGTTDKEGYHYPVERHVYATDGITTIQDELFLFNERELTGTRVWGSDDSVNQIYIPWFKNNTANMGKTYNGIIDNWWAATPRSGGYFCLSRTDGTFATSYASTSYGCAPGFCLS